MVSILDCKISSNLSLVNFFLAIDSPDRLMMTSTFGKSLYTLTTLKIVELNVFFKKATLDDEMGLTVSE